MSYAPATLRALLAYWVGRGGVSLGAVGDAAHTIGYHLGRDRIYGPEGRGDADYSVISPRDRSALTDAVAAVDLGHADLATLRAFSCWLVAEARAGAEGTGDIREVIYSPDGQRVMCWDRERGHSSAPLLGEGDTTHLWHTHVSYYRDAEQRDKVMLLERYLEGHIVTPSGRSMHPEIGVTAELSGGPALAGGEA